MFVCLHHVPPAVAELEVFLLLSLLLEVGGGSRVDVLLHQILQRLIVKRGQ